MSFSWMPLYAEIADKVLEFEDRQDELLSLLRAFERRGLNVISLQDLNEQNQAIPLAVMEPFTFFASFNRPITNKNRLDVLGAIKDAWKLAAPLPDEFHGIPTIDHRNAWSFSYARKRQSQDISSLWRAAKDGVHKTWQTFDHDIFDAALRVRQVGLTRLTMSLFWLNPRGFLATDGNTKNLFPGAPSASKSARGYVTWLSSIVAIAGADFPQISKNAYDASRAKDAEESLQSPHLSPGSNTQERIYTSEDALFELFFSADQLDFILKQLKRKKALILQGPPGVGKTFVAHRIAYTLMEEQDRSRVATVQFHPGYGYDDFVQGYRPSVNGLKRQDGVFYRFAEAARADPSRKYCFVIDEINRGNLAAIFGELLMLLEADKRKFEYAVELTYSQGEKPFALPPNLYVIGTMNTADRSLSMVDYALRRRFAFVTLEPAIDSNEFANWLTGAGATSKLVEQIQSRLSKLNKAIDDEKDLGPRFRIGHSFFCPGEGITPDDDWYCDVINCEIKPLLEEYFDKPETVKVLVDQLLGQ